MINFRFHKHFIASALSLQLASCGSNADFDDFVLEDTQSASETGSQTPQGDQALPEALYTESLIDDAELSVYAVGTTNMVSVTAPAEPSAAFLERLQAASAEVSLDGLYRAWTGKETLPDILVDRAEIEQLSAQHRAEQTDELDPIVPTEESPEDFELAAESALPQAELGAAFAAAPPGHDYIADARAWFSSACARTAQRWDRMDVPNMLWFQRSITGRYQRFALRNASFEPSTASFEMTHPGFNGVLPLGSRQSVFWFVTSDIRQTVSMRGTGGGVDPRVDMCAIWGGEKINGASTVRYQNSRLTLKVWGTGFPQGDSLVVDYMNPVHGPIPFIIRSRQSKADTTFTLETVDRRCHELKIDPRDPRFFNQTLRVTGSDGRQAFYTTPSLRDACPNG